MARRRRDRITLSDMADAFSNVYVAAVLATGGTAMLVLYYALEPANATSSDPFTQLSHIFWQYGLLADFLLGCCISAVGYLALAYHFGRHILFDRAGS